MQERYFEKNIIDMVEKEKQLNAFNRIYDG